MTRESELRTVRIALLAAVVVSVFHYVDNTVRYDDYTKHKHTLIKLPVVPIAWVVFTAAGVAGYVYLRRGVRTYAAPLLAFYSVSGLIGVLHYTVAPPRDFDWYQNTFIILDTVTGLIVLAMAARLWLHPATRTSPT
jgi:hypothetical protein